MRDNEVDLFNDDDAKSCLNIEIPEWVVSDGRVPVNDGRIPCEQERNVVSSVSIAQIEAWM